MKKTYHGSCHCSVVCFEAAIDLDQGTSKCNCSFCAKTRFWKAFVDENALRVTSGSNYLTEYQFGSRTIVHFFCRTCGVKPFGRGETADMGVFYAINVACLDDLTPDELLKAPVEYQDGKHDLWERKPQDVRHL
ncbi:GFA family protein [Phyllobacterium zundukense]|uniref:GFA family protein n=1 Tax=Phyllobacterium zundukense TaxID=1867719 RepID=A0ACD4D491_9HYPH|nr:GFA family protein [Phyllobacterium zundukense]UXN60742.1 GFA family protein [Phyllobacterium zundukense]